MMTITETKDCLTKEQKSSWLQWGFFTIEDYLSQDENQQLIEWVEAVKNSNPEDTKQLNYYEKIDGLDKVSRAEFFLDSNSKFNIFSKELVSRPIFKELLGANDIVLFKDKVNYKYPGMGEYLAHQDIHAFDTSPLAFQEYHINCALFLDETTQENGCLEVCLGDFNHKVLPRKPSGAIQDGVISEESWVPLELSAGSLLVFNMFLPHRSKRNFSNVPRRTLFYTINNLENGNNREAHRKDRLSSKRATREISQDLYFIT